MVGCLSQIAIPIDNVDSKNARHRHGTKDGESGIEQGGPGWGAVLTVGGTAVNLATSLQNEAFQTKLSPDGGRTACVTLVQRALWHHVRRCLGLVSYVPCRHVAVGLAGGSLNHRYRDCLSPPPVVMGDIPFRCQSSFGAPPTPKIRRNARLPCWSLLASSVAKEAAKICSSCS